MTQSTVQWRPSTREEIKSYYTNEFPTRSNKRPEWVTATGPKQYALALDRRFPDYKEGKPPVDFIRRDTRSDGDYAFGTWEDVEQFLQNPADADPLPEIAKDTEGNSQAGLVDPNTVNGPRPVPEAAYYALDHHERFWVLSFDIDAKDVAKLELAGHTIDIDSVSEEQIKNAGIVAEAPSPVPHPRDDDGELHEYAYRFEHIDKAIDLGFDLVDWLENMVGFNETRVFYSGQGVHVYALDDRPHYQWTYQSRRFITGYIRQKLDIPIDEPVTWDQERVIRIPQTLHTDVSRIVTPISSRDFDYRNNSRPQFMAGE